MITEERIQKLPDWIKRTIIFLRKMRIPGKMVYVLISLLATLWVLFRVIPKPSRAAYPCMQVAAPIMSGFVIWVMAITGSAYAFKKAKSRLLEARYIAAGMFITLGIVFASLYTLQSDAKTDTSKLEIWYKPNIPLGVAKGIFPGRVVWTHNPKIASWDGKTGFWWDDAHNDQKETDKLLKETLSTLTDKKTEKAAWDIIPVKK
jgi:hypothetical protein